MSSVVVSGDTSGSITISAPAVSGTNTLTLPVATDTLVGKATTDTLTNKSIVASQLTGTVAAARLPAGSVIQVVSVIKSDTFTTSSASLVDVTGLTVSITPASASNKVLVLVQVNGSQDVAANRTYLRLLRGGTTINAGDVASLRLPIFGSLASPADSIFSASAAGMYLDSPATTSSTTYKIQVASAAGSGTCCINRSDQDNDEVGQGRAASTITLMEIQG